MFGTLFVGFDEDNPMLKPPWNYPSQFVWGWSPITQLPETLRFYGFRRTYQHHRDFRLAKRFEVKDRLFFKFGVNLHCGLVRFRLLALVVKTVENDWAIVLTNAILLQHLSVLKPWSSSTSDFLPMRFLLLPCLGSSLCSVPLCR